MGDVLPPKRQTVVDRLRRRIELYRRHQNGCLPRYEQAANGLYDQQRQDTILLKQRYLEAKAKKAKRSDHRSAKESNADAQKIISGQRRCRVESPGACAMIEGKLKNAQSRPLKGVPDNSPATLTPDTVTDDSELIRKVARTESSTPDQTIPDQSSLPSFSVQIVQQFTNSNPSQAQHSQTIQTNVTVKALSGSVKTCNSPHAAKGQSESQQSQTQPPQQPTTPVSSTSNAECKQEKEDADGGLCLCRTQGSTSGGDRLSDTFPSIGFAEDSNDDVIHPDILKDLIDDVFTNSADIMKDFNFEDSVSSVKDPDESEKDADSNLLDLVKVSSPSQFQPFQSEATVFDGNKSSQSQGEGLGLFSSSSVSNTTAVTATTTSPTSTSSSLYPQPTQLPSFNSPSGASLSMSSGLGLDFKLTEPSPAALTLKQMAEQHQNMQQKQQHMNMGMASPLSNGSGRGQYSQDTFTDTLSSMRSSYINGPDGKMNPVPKGPNSSGMFHPVGYDPVNGYPGMQLFGNSSSFKQEVCMSGVGGHLPESDLQQKQNFHMRQMPSSHPNGSNHDPPAYCATRPLSHYPGQLSQGNLPHPLSGQYKSAMPPDLRIQMNQNQPMHMSHNPQQVLPTSPDLKQQLPMVQPHPNVYGTYPKQSVNNPMFHVAMSQSMSYTSRFGPNSAVNRPPPDYKVHPPSMSSAGMPMVEQHDPSALLMYHNPSVKSVFPPQSVPANQDAMSLGHRSAAAGGGEWRHGNMHHHQGVSRMDNYSNSQEDYSMIGAEGSYPSGMPRMAMLHPYRMMGHHMNPGKMPPRSQLVNSNHAMMSQRQQMSLQASALNHRLSSSAMELQGGPSLQLVANGPPQVNSAGLNCGSSDMSRQDGHHINLDFLDNIESSASDFLNFDQVIQSSGTHFQLLDEMEMLSK